MKASVRFLNAEKADLLTKNVVGIDFNLGGQSHHEQRIRIAFRDDRRLNVFVALRDFERNEAPCLELSVNRRQFTLKDLKIVQTDYPVRNGLFGKSKAAICSFSYSSCQ